VASIPRLLGRFGKINPLAVLVQLVVVFIGVYAAFALSEYREARQLEDRRERVLALLAEGIEQYGSSFGSFAEFHESHNAEFRAQLDRGELPDYSDWYYIAPQYPIDLINYLVTTQGSDLFDQDLFEPLTRYATMVEMLMYAEERMTRLGDAYRPPPPPGAPGAEAIRAEQRAAAERFYNYLEVRRGISAGLAQHASDLSERLEALRD
jgi:hypothetical protein